MNIIHVTTWSARKRHLADADSVVNNQYGHRYTETLCREVAVLEGGRTERSDVVRQKFIEDLDPCKRCEKKSPVQ